MDKKLIRKLLMVLQLCLLTFGLVIGCAGGVMYWNIVSNGVPEIVDLKTLHTTKAKYARITAALDDTGVHIPRDKKSGESYFYTVELEDKLVLVNSSHKREEGPALTFFVLIRPYEGTHAETYFAFLAAARGVSVHDVQMAYAGKMLQYFDSNPEKYTAISSLMGFLTFACGLIWTLKAKNIKEIIRTIFTLHDGNGRTR